jgi:hypothetical protein
MISAVVVSIPEAGAVGRIPIVKRVLKNNQGLLRALGLEKELKRFGVKIPQSKDQESSSDKATAKPAVLMFTVTGPLGNANFQWVMEESIEPKTKVRLKRLVHESQ